MSRILLVNADPTIEEQIHQALTADNYQITCAHSISEALSVIAHVPPDLFILETAQFDSLALCRQIRETPKVSDAAVLFLTETYSAAEIAAVLDAGADDHLRQPFAERELAARVRALLRRTVIKQMNKKPHRALLTLEPQLLAVCIDEQRIVLSPVEFELMTALCKHHNRYLSSSDLLREVWHYPLGTGDTALVRNHIHNLRMKIEDDPDHPRVVLSHQGRGYMLSANIGDLV